MRSIAERLERLAVNAIVAVHRSGMGGAADEAVLNNLHKKVKFPLYISELIQ
jgi:hypothetical protein